MKNNQNIEVAVDHNFHLKTQKVMSAWSPEGQKNTNI